MGELGLKKMLCKQNVPQHAAGSRSTLCAKAFRKRKRGGAPTVVILRTFYKANAQRLSHSFKMVLVLKMSSCSSTLQRTFFSLYLGTLLAPALSLSLTLILGRVSMSQKFISAAGIVWFWEECIYKPAPVSWSSTLSKLWGCGWNMEMRLSDSYLKSFFSCVLQKCRSDQCLVCERPPCFLWGLYFYLQLTNELPS